MARRFYSTSRPIAAIGAIDKPARPADSAVESERRAMKFPRAVVRAANAPANLSLIAGVNRVRAAFVRHQASTPGVIELLPDGVRFRVGHSSRAKLLWRKCPPIVDCPALCTTLHAAFVALSSRPIAIGRLLSATKAACKVVQRAGQSTIGGHLRQSSLAREECPTRKRTPSGSSSMTPGVLAWRRTNAARRRFTPAISDRLAGALAARTTARGNFIARRSDSTALK